MVIQACVLAATPAFAAGGDESGSAAAADEMAGPAGPRYGGTLTMKFD